MKLAWMTLIALGRAAAAESQVELAAKANQDGVDLMMKSKYDDAVVTTRAGCSSTSARRA